MIDGVTRFRNKKTGRIYILMHCSIDCTNSRDGTHVVIYCDELDQENVYVRDRGEFFDKFEEVKTDGIYTICDAIYAMEQKASYNVAEVEDSRYCGCYHCASVFECEEALLYTTDEGATALCPRCGHDTVLANVTDIPLLYAGRLAYFENTFPDDCGMPIDADARKMFC